MQMPMQPDNEVNEPPDGPAGGDSDDGMAILNKLEALTEKLRGAPTSTGSAARGAQILNDLEALTEHLRQNGGSPDHPIRPASPGGSLDPMSRPSMPPRPMGG